REARRVYTTLGQRIVVLDGAAEPSPVWKAGVWARIDQYRYAKSIAEFVAPGSADRRRWIRWVAPLGAVAAIALMALWLNQSMGKRSFPGVVSDQAIPAAAGGLDQDAAASLRAGALVQAGDPIAVR